MPAMGTISRRTAGTPKLLEVREEGYRGYRVYVPGIGSLAALYKLLLFFLVHLLELKVACVSCRTKSATLQDHKENGSHDRDEVEREIHEVADDGAGCELCKWLCRKLAQLRDWVTSGLDGALLRDQSGHVARHECAIEGVNKSIVNKEIFAQQIEDRRALAEHEKNGRNEGERTVEYGEDSGLRHVCHNEHEHRDAEAKGDCRYQLCSERTP